MDLSKLFFFLALWQTKPFYFCHSFWKTLYIVLKRVLPWNKWIWNTNLFLYYPLRFTLQFILKVTFMDVSIWYLDLDTLSWFFHFQRVRDIFFEVVSKCQKRQQQEFVWYMYFVHRLLRRWFGWSGWNGWFRVCIKKTHLASCGWYLKASLS